MDAVKLKRILPINLQIAAWKDSPSLHSDLDYSCYCCYSLIVVYLALWIFLPLHWQSSQLFQIFLNPSFLLLSNAHLASELASYLLLCVFEFPCRIRLASWTITPNHFDINSESKLFSQRFLFWTALSYSRLPWIYPATCENSGISVVYGEEKQSWRDCSSLIMHGEF